MSDAPFDADFELLPAEGLDVTPDDELAAALADAAAPADEQPPVPLGRGWAFDFEAGQFRTLGQAPAEVSGLANLRVWIEKALRTARGAHPIYTDEFGIDVVDLIGEQPTPGLLAAYSAAVEDALLAHDRITAVRDFRFDWNPSSERVEVGFVVVVDEAEQIVIEPTALGG